MFYRTFFKQKKQPVMGLVLWTIIFIVSAFPCWAQRSRVPRSVISPPVSGVQAEAAYTLGTGDRIRIDNVKLPQYSSEYLIPPDGLLNLPLIGTVSVRGLTLAGAAQTIEARYNRILKRPQIAIRLVEPRPVNIVVSGEVNRPGSLTIPLLDTRQPGLRYPTVTQVIQQAEGVTQFADLRRVQVRRQQGGARRAITVNLEAFWQTGTAGQDILLRDGDIVFVPTATNVTPTQARQIATSSVATDITKPRTIAIVGEVARPGVYVVKGGNAQSDRLSEGLPTVTRAIELAGGITATADLSRIQVRRSSRTGVQQTFNLDLKQLLQAGDSSQDLIVQDGDTILIPTANNFNQAQADQLARASFGIDINTPRTVVVVGEVSHPGTYVVKGGNAQSERLSEGYPTVTRALQLAGGVTATADISNIQLRRSSRGGVQQTLNINLRQLLASGDATQDLIVQEGDIIFVPTATNFNQAQANELATASFGVDMTKPRTVTVLGEVSRPGSYVVIGGDTSTDRNSGGIPTLTRAIQLAGGITPAANVRSIQLRRLTRTGAEQVMEVNLWQFLQAGDTSQNPIVQQGDTIFIPTTTNFNRAEANILASTNFATNIDQPRTVAVVGEVKRPGIYVIIGGLVADVDRRTGGLPTVTRALQRAGGITSSADIRHIEIRRQTKSGIEQTISVNFWQLLQAGDFTQDSILQDGDTVFVPTATDINPAEVSQIADSSFSPATIQVSVVGEVTRPGRIEVPPNTTLNQALLTAGGFNRSRANKNIVELIRLNSNGTISRRPISIDFTQGINDMTNPLLNDNDIVVVRRNGVARFSDNLDNIIGGGGLFSVIRVFQILGIFD